MKRAVLWLVVVCSFAAAYGSAAAQVPPECTSTTNARAYRTGRLAGANIAQQSWASLNDCDRVEQYEDVVISALERYSPGGAPTLYTRCRFRGVVEGVLDALDVVFASCVDACFLEGQFAGEISAFAYCELSIALNGLETADDFLRGPVQVCGLSFEIGCDTQFIDTSSAYDNELGSCEPFTAGEFQTVFDQARENQCAYNPIDPEEETATDEHGRKGSGS
jgi:hypothetical protein